MTRLRFVRSALLVATFLALVPAGRAATTNPPSDFKEVYDLIHAHLPGATDTDLNRAAVDGLLSGFSGRVQFAENQSAGTTNAPLTSRAAIIDPGVAYVRIGRIADGLAAQLNADINNLKATNQLKGLVIDLRNATGTDYAVAAATADLFVAKERLLLDWSDGSAHSKNKSNALTLPVAVLVNHGTSGAAEALAAVLREAGAGLLIGANTAGHAMLMQDYPLKDGRHLLVATKVVKLADGTELTTSGVKADIQVAVDADAERAWLNDPFSTPGQPVTTSASSDTATSTDATRTPRRRLSEADLVREKREGVNMDDDAAMSRPPDPEKPLIRDPALARAVDLLKALALVRDAHN